MATKIEPIIHSLPEVHKTPRMRVIELENGGRDIRLIIADLYKKNGGNKAAVVEALEIDYALLYQWADRLGLEFEHNVAINGQRVTQEA